MLVRAIMRITLLTCAVMLLYIGVLHMRPYQYPAGFELIMPEPGCESHCMLGIEPGVTTVDEAVALLESHPAVAEVIFHSGTDIVWKWDNRYKGLQRPNINFRNSIIYRDGNLSTLQIALPIRVYEYRLLYGSPEKIHGDWLPSSVVGNDDTFIVNEQFTGFNITYAYECSLHRRAKPYEQVTMIYYPPPSYASAIHIDNYTFSDATC